ncbi:MAG TPA: M1 family metallopeptidase [Gemmatimonadaceae bacterium]|nr:M1 family metallopeptidase [Gemmatimonadaceae bacterium]
MRILPVVVLLAGSVAGCARWPFHRAAPAPAPTAAPSRPIPYPVFETRAFTRAVERGARTRTGEPGPNYWQQFARYRIDAELVPATSLVNGRETVRYFNRSPDTLRAVWIYLNQNLFAPTAARVESVPVTGGMEILRVAAWGQALSKRDTGAGYWVNGTLMRVSLPRALSPRDSLDLDIAWAFQVPPDGAPREGSTGDAFMIAYWYPQLAVYDDLTGWQIDPYLGNAEFYMGYADYEVGLTVPQGWLVGATGELSNAADVLSRQTRDRLAEARRGANVVHVVREQDRGAGPNKATNTGFDGVVTWRFRANNVRDFDWGTSSKFLWDATAAVVGDRDADHKPDTTVVHTLYRPEARRWAWDKSAEYERNVVEFLSSYLWPYPWRQMTALEGPVSCSGMEYPMLACIGGPRDTLSLYSVQVHETAHMWFPMQVGSDERRYAWQDEGLTRFNQAQGMQAYFKGYDRERISRDAYLALARTDSEVPLMRPGDQFPAGTPAYGIASYDKMSTNMSALRALLGNDGFSSAYRTYGLRWADKHPSPYDFFNTFNTMSGRDLSWFWRTWWYETWTLDQAIGSVAATGGKLAVTIEDRGLAPMPVRLAITRGSRVERREIPVDVWLSGARRYTLTLDDPETVTAIEIDPDNAFPDIDRSNNRWVARPEK